MVTQRAFQKGDFLLEYRGDLVDKAEADRRRTTYTDEQAVFLFDFKWKD